jgi:phage shock protein A
MRPSEQARAWAALSPQQQVLAIQQAVHGSGLAALVPVARALGVLLAWLPAAQAQALRTALLAPIIDPTGLDTALAALRDERDELARQLATRRADGQCQAVEQRLRQLDADCRRLSAQITQLQSELVALDAEMRAWGGAVPDPDGTDTVVPSVREVTSHGDPSVPTTNPAFNRILISAGDPAMAGDLCQFVARLHDQLHQQCTDLNVDTRTEITRLTTELATLADADAQCTSLEQVQAALRQRCTALEDRLEQRRAALARQRAARCAGTQSDIGALLDECEALAADAVLADAAGLLGAHPDTFTPAALAQRLARDLRPEEVRGHLRDRLVLAAADTAGMPRLAEEEAGIAAECEALAQEIADLETALREAHRVDATLLAQLNGLDAWQLDEFTAQVQTWQRRLAIEQDWAIPINIAGGLDDGH